MYSRRPNYLLALLDLVCGVAIVLPIARGLALQISERRDYPEFWARSLPRSVVVFAVLSLARIAVLTATLWNQGLFLRDLNGAFLSWLCLDLIKTGASFLYARGWRRFAEGEVATRATSEMKGQAVDSPVSSGAAPVRPPPEVDDRSTAP